MLISNVGNTQRVWPSGYCNPVWNCFDSDTKMENEEAEEISLRLDELQRDIDAILTILRSAGYLKLALSGEPKLVDAVSRYRI